MKANLGQRAEGLGSRIAEISEGAAHIKELVADAFEDGVDSAKSALKRGRRTAEDTLDSTAYQIKRHPLESVGMMFGLGLVCGLACGWIAGRKRQVKQG